MSLEYAILGFLNYQPLSGYDLKKVFDTTVRHFWPADQSQIYRTLARLTEHGWVTQEVIEQNDRPDRKVYHITGTGKEELRRWLVGPFPEPESRSAALIKVFFAGQLPDDDILRMFEEAAHSLLATQEPYASLGAQIEKFADLAGSEREMYFWLSTLEMGKKSVAANVEWAQSVIRELKRKKVPTHTKSKKPVR
jgi:PadR family transcriptional regulator, regulatory protein AphA